MEFMYLKKSEQNGQTKSGLFKDVKSARDNYNV